MSDRRFKGHCDECRSYDWIEWDGWWAAYLCDRCFLLLDEWEYEQLTGGFGA